MSELREQIAGLYYRSNSVQFGEFRLFVHVDNPELPLSPYYLHYPKPEEQGSELLQFGADSGYASQEQVDATVKYRALNQY
jgi:hypothetical protein